MESETLIESAIRVLNTSDLHKKARLGDSISVKWLQGYITEPHIPNVDLPVPDRPACLTNDIIARFGKQEKMPRDFFTDFVKVAQDEGRHFTLPAHEGLWDSATTTSQDLFARLAMEHCVNEARGLDVLPTTISRFRNGGDNETADLLERIVYLEEITHCAAGVKWFKYLCARSKDPEFTINNKESDNCNEEIIKKFNSVVREHFRGPLKPPFNAEARKAAGFGPQWYEPLAVQESYA